MLEKSVEVRFQGHGEGIRGLGELKGGGSSGCMGSGLNPIPKACEFPPQWSRASLPLTSLSLSQEVLRLPIITL